MKSLLLFTLVLFPVVPIYAGGPCVPNSWQQRLATITPDGTLVTFFPNCYPTYGVPTATSMNGKKVSEFVTHQLPVTKENMECVVEWTEDGTNWSLGEGKSLAFETDGKSIDVGALRERLKQPTLVVVSQSGSMISQNVVGMLKPGTIVLVPPEVEKGHAPLPVMEGLNARPTRVRSGRDSSFQLVAFQDPTIPAKEKPGIEFPNVTSPPPSAFAVVWRNPDQVTLIGKFEKEFLAKGVYKVSDGTNKVLKEAKVRHRFVNIESVDYPAFSVSAKTVDGRQLTPAILQRYLQVERTVVVPSSQNEIDPFWLQNFRPIVVVMTVPDEVVAVPMPAPATPVPADQGEVSIPAKPVTKRPLRMATPEELDQLLTAAANADDEQVTKFLSEGLNINQQNAEGETALMRAAANGHNGYVETLITNHMADSSLRNKAGKTAEQLAREKGHDATADAITKHQN